MGSLPKCGSGCGDKGPYESGILDPGGCLHAAGSIHGHDPGGSDGRRYVGWRQAAGKRHRDADPRLARQCLPIHAASRAAERSVARSASNRRIHDEHVWEATSRFGREEPGPRGTQTVGIHPNRADDGQPSELSASRRWIDGPPITVEMAMELDRPEPRRPRDLQNFLRRHAGEDAHRQDARGERRHRLAGSGRLDPPRRADHKVETHGIGPSLSREPGIGGRGHATDLHVEQGHGRRRRCVHQMGGVGGSGSDPWRCSHTVGAFRATGRIVRAFLTGRVYGGMLRYRNHPPLVETNFCPAPPVRPLPSLVTPAMHVPSRHPSSRPFMASPRTQFYYAATEIDGALKGIERCIRRAEGVALVVGQPGTGKSLLLLKLAEHIRDDFDVALLTGASICTRRALWQSILAAIGEPYRGIDEADLRIAVVERIRGLAATGSGLVILVDEAHTLPTRLIEELRLLTNIPTPMPAVHIVLAGTLRLDEMLGASRMASLAQRIAVRGYLESLDHTETLAYLRAQMTAAGLVWDKVFETGSDDAVYRATEGVPRLMNQLCDQALVLVAESSRRVTSADIAAAWREIQRLPAPAGVEPTASTTPMDDEPMSAAFDDDFGGEGLGVIEFGAGDEPVSEQREPAEAASADPWDGPDIELVFDPSSDPFEELFADEERVVERYVMTGPDDFRERRQVKSREGHSMGRLLASIGRDMAERPKVSQPAEAVAAPCDESVAPSDNSESHLSMTIAVEGDLDDTDMVVIEEDMYEVGSETAAPVLSVRPSDYRSLFTRLRRGDR